MRDKKIQDGGKSLSRKLFFLIVDVPQDPKSNQED